MANTTQKQTTKNPVESLEGVLQEQLNLLTQYKDALAKDHAHIAKLELEELEKSNKAKTTLLLKIQAMDQARENFVKQTAELLKLKLERVRLDDICKVVTADAAKRLRSLKDDLTTTVDELKKLQEETQAMAGSSLTWINGSLQTLKNLLTPSATYNLQGQVDHPNMFAGRTVERRA